MNITEILQLKEHVLPETIFELFFQWSCGFDEDSLRTLINETIDFDLFVSILEQILHWEISFLLEFHLLNREQHSIIHVLILLIIFVVFIIFFSVIVKHLIS